MQVVNDIHQFHNSEWNESTIVRLPTIAIPTDELEDGERDQPRDQVRHHGYEQLEDDPDAHGDRNDHREHPDHGVVVEVQRYSSNRCRLSSLMLERISDSIRSSCRFI